MNGLDVQLFCHAPAQLYVCLGEVFNHALLDWHVGLAQRINNVAHQVILICLAEYTVEFDRLVAKTPIEGAKFRLTIVSGGRAVEQTIGLD